MRRRKMRDSLDGYTIILHTRTMIKKYKYNIQAEDARNTSRDKKNTMRTISMAKKSIIILHYL